MVNHTLESQVIEEQDDPLQGEIIVAENVTFEEFLTRFSEHRVEWIDGKVILLTMSNNKTHQAILLFLSSLFNLYLGFKNLGQVLLAGMPMRLPNVKRGPEPDLLIVMNDHLNRVQQMYLEGPADIALEIVSPESTQRDRGCKFREYEEGGVREYWLVDPIREEAIVYVLGEDGRFHPNPLDSQGRLNSRLLPDFALHPSLLWRDPLPTGQELVELAQSLTR